MKRLSLKPPENAPVAGSVWVLNGDHTHLFDVRGVCFRNQHMGVVSWFVSFEKCGAYRRNAWNAYETFTLTAFLEKFVPATDEIKGLYELRNLLRGSEDNIYNAR
jgi:hypothetical protein